MVLARGRRRALPGRRHLVADRDRRHPDLANFPGAMPMKPGSATQPLPGIEPLLVDAEGHESSTGAASGNLCLASTLAGADAHRVGRPRPLLPDLFQHLSRPLFHRRRLPPRRGRLLLDHRPGRRRDQRLGPPHRHRRGRKRAGRRIRWSPRPRWSASRTTSRATAIYAFVTLNAGEEGGDALRKELVQEVRHDIGALATPEKIQFTPALPKTRSGKIMRRILRKIAEGRDRAASATLRRSPIRQSSRRWLPGGSELQARRSNAVRMDSTVYGSSRVRRSAFAARNAAARSILCPHSTSASRTSSFRR